MGGYYHTEYMEYMLKKGGDVDISFGGRVCTRLKNASPPFFFVSFVCWVFVGLSHTRYYEYCHTSSAE